MADYDVAVIGAGNGGLTASLALAKAGVKTLLLERHNIPGGCATSFKRGRFEFEVALHQLSGIGTDAFHGPLHNTFGDLDILGDIELIQMDSLYRIVYPGKIDITLPADRTGIVKTLQENYPKESDRIKQFFDMLWDYCTQWISVEMMRDPEATPLKYPLYFKYALKSTQEVMDQFLTDPMLQTAVNIYWSYIGLPPSLLSFRDFALVFWAYSEMKPFHIKGGSQVLSNALLNSYTEAGGEVQFNCGVEKINVSNGAVTGIVTENGDEVSVSAVISNASTLTTYVDLIGSEHIPQSEVDALGARNVGVSAFTLFMGFDREPEELGIKQTTNFFATTTDAEEAFAITKTMQEPGFMLFSCYDVDDPEFSPPGTCQAAFLTLTYAEPWLSISPNQYNDAKYKYAENMLKILYQVFPECENHVEEIEVGTPLTHMRYLGHPGGAIYGFENMTKDSDLFMDKKSPIKGLFTAGSWSSTGGFQPTLMAGNSTAKAVIRSLKG